MTGSERDAVTAYLVVRKELLRRLNAGMSCEELPEVRSLWGIAEMDHGDVSEFTAMMMNVELILEVPKVACFDWYAWETSLE